MQKLRELAGELTLDTRCPFLRAAGEPHLVEVRGNNPYQDGQVLQFSWPVGSVWRREVARKYGDGGWQSDLCLIEHLPQAAGEKFGERNEFIPARLSLMMVVQRDFLFDVTHLAKRHTAAYELAREVLGAGIKRGLVGLESDELLKFMREANEVMFPRDTWLTDDSAFTVMPGVKQNVTEIEWGEDDGEGVRGDAAG